MINVFKKLILSRLTVILQKIDYYYFVEISSFQEPLIIPGIVSEFHILVQNNNQDFCIFQMHC